MTVDWTVDSEAISHRDQESSLSPLVSIGMPIFNGGKYIRFALDSILDQDYIKFELIISDNASTDDTLSICRDYAAADERIRIVVQSENIGAMKNFQFVLDEARGSYFMWAAHDDQWDENYISTCLDALTHRATAVTCCSHVVFLDAQGQRVERSFANLDTRNLDVRQRVQMLLSQQFWCAFYGLHRIDAVRRGRADRSLWGSDVILTLELLLQGEIIRSDETCFHYRTFATKTLDMMKNDIDPNRPDWPRFTPYTEMIRGMLYAVARSDLSPIDSVRVSISLLRTALFSNQLLRTLIPEENVTMFFESNRVADHHGVIQSAMPAIVLRPALLMNRGVWIIVGRAMLSVTRRRLSSSSRNGR